MNIFRNINGARLLAGTARSAAVAFELHALNGQRTHAQGISESGGDHFEIVDALGVGFLVDAIERRDAFRFQILRDALVSREHELFDQAMCDVALGTRDALHQSEFVELDDGLGQVEVDRSAALALVVENQGEIAHQFECGDKRRVTRARGGIALEHVVDGGIRHALGGADHAFAQLVADNFPVRVNVHHAGKHQPVKMRTQAADISGKFERQHGHSPVGKIDTGAAQPSFLVERRIRCDVLRHIGDVDLQFKISVGKVAYRNGIVEVAGGFAVDGDDGQRAEITAMAKLLRWNHGGDGLRLFECRRGKVVRQVKFTDGDFHVDAEIVLTAENFEDAAARILRGRGPVGDFDIDHDAFEIVPVRMSRGLVPEHAIWRFLLARSW